MRVVLDINVLVSAALKQKSMPRMAALVVERRGAAKLCRNDEHALPGGGPGGSPVRT
jgi:hypothetical protein